MTKVKLVLYIVQQNAIFAILDSTGTAVVQYKYDAWGNHTVSGSNVTLGNLNPFRYRSYFYDTETKLYFLQSRYYDPEVGRFLNMDSAGYADPQTVNGLNLYAYCRNNPVMNIDPTGTFGLQGFLNSIGNFFNEIGNGFRQIGDNISNLFRFDNGLADNFGFEISIDLSINNSFNDIVKISENAIKNFNDGVDFVVTNIDEFMTSGARLIWNDILGNIVQNENYNDFFSYAFGAISIFTIPSFFSFAGRLGPAENVIGFFSALLMFRAAWEKRRNK